MTTARSVCIVCRLVNSFDSFQLAQRFGSTPSFTSEGKMPDSARYDLNADDAINVLDVFVLAVYFNKV